MATSQITHGPNKYELMLALFDRTAEKPRSVCFTVKHARNDEVVERKLHISAVSIEDGSGDSWLIECQTEDFGRVLNGYYNTKTRSGHLKPGRLGSS